LPVSETVILIGESEPHIVELVKLGFSDTPYRLIEASNGDGVLELARKETPSLIILEVLLPGPGGLEICQQLKTDPATARIPVLFLTVKDLEADREHGYQSGADGYLAKPVSPLRLRAEVDYLLSMAKSG